jgi:hypothetical protein
MDLLDSKKLLNLINNEDKSLNFLYLDKLKYSIIPLIKDHENSFNVWYKIFGILKKSFEYEFNELQNMKIQQNEWKNIIKETPPFLDTLYIEDLICLFKILSENFNYILSNNLDINKNKTYQFLDNIISKYILEYFKDKILFDYYENKILYIYNNENNLYDLINGENNINNEIKNILTILYNLLETYIPKIQHIINQKILLKYRDYIIGIIKSTKQEFKSFMNDLIRSYKIKDKKQNENMIPFKNKMINLKTLEVIDRTPNYFITKNINPRIQYLENYNETPEFIKDIIHKDFIEDFQKLLGYTLTDNKDQYMIILYGEGSNGKSKLLEFLTNILSSFIQEIDYNSLLKKEVNDLIRKYSLNDKKIFYLDEFEKDATLRERYLKNLISLPCKFILSTNYKPQFDINSFSMIRRIIFINFETKFVYSNNLDSFKNPLEKQRINNYSCNLDELFSWIIKGSYKYFNEGLNYSKFENITKKHFDNDSFIIFKEICIINEEGAKIKSSELYKNYYDFIKEDPSMKLLNQKEFTINLKNLGYELKRFSQGMFWNNIKYIPLSLENL